MVCLNELKQKKFEKLLLDLREKARKLKEENKLGYFSFSYGKYIIYEDLKKDVFRVAYHCLNKKRNGEVCDNYANLVFNRVVFEIKCNKCNKNIWKMSGKISMSKKRQMKREGKLNEPLEIKELSW